MSLRIDATDICHGAYNYGGNGLASIDVDNDVQFDGRQIGTYIRLPRTTNRPVNVILLPAMQYVRVCTCCHEKKTNI